MDVHLPPPLLSLLSYIVVVSIVSMSHHLSRPTLSFLSFIVVVSIVSMSHCPPPPPLIAVSHSCRQYCFEGPSSSRFCLTQLLPALFRCSIVLLLLCLSLLSYIIVVSIVWISNPPPLLPLITVLHSYRFVLFGCPIVLLHILSLLPNNADGNYVGCPVSLVRLLSFLSYIVVVNIDWISYRLPPQSPLINHLVVVSIVQLPHLPPLPPLIAVIYSCHQHCFDVPSSSHFFHS